MSSKKKKLTDAPPNTFYDKGDTLEAALGLRSATKRTTAGPSTRDLELALAVVLVDLASCDQNFEPREYLMISNGLRRMFNTSKDQVTALVNQANMVLANLRGTTQFTKLLAEHLDEDQKIAAMEIIDEIIKADGQEDGFEIYLRNKAAAMLGVKQEKEAAR